MRDTTKVSVIFLVSFLCLIVCLYLLVDTYHMVKILRDVDKGWFSTKVLEKGLYHMQIWNYFFAFISAIVCICSAHIIIFTKEYKRFSALMEEEDDNEEITEEVIERDARDIREGKVKVPDWFNKAMDRKR